jgi:3-dehydroquinate dehydratase-2
MNKILLIHGPNLNLLGKRDPTHYGHLTLASLETLVTEAAAKNNFQIIPYQSNHEGYLIDTLQEKAADCAGILINPGALTHYSYALYDALLDTAKPIVEVHLSAIDNRETWRSHSVTASACLKVIWGKKELGYLEALEFLIEYLKKQ